MIVCTKVLQPGHSDALGCARSLHSLWFDHCAPVNHQLEGSQPVKPAVGLTGTTACQTALYRHGLEGASSDPHLPRCLKGLPRQTLIAPFRKLASPLGAKWFGQSRETLASCTGLYGQYTELCRALQSAISYNPPPPHRPSPLLIKGRPQCLQRLTGIPSRHTLTRAVRQLLSDGC